MCRKVLNSYEAAEFLRLPLPSLYVLVAKREIPFIKAGKRRLRFFEDDLVGYLEEKRVAPMVSRAS